MSKTIKILACTVLVLSFFMSGIGYASITDLLNITGNVNVIVPEDEYDIFIESITPDSSGGVYINNYYSTLMSSTVVSLGSASFTIVIRNRSNKTYVFERVVEGSEVNVEGVYDGTGITHRLIGLSFLQEVAPAETVTFNLQLTVNRGVTTDNFMLYYKFVEKTGTEVLPGGEETEEPTEAPTEEPTETPTDEPVDTDDSSEIVTEEPTEAPTEAPEETETEAETGPLKPEDFANDFLGLVQALLSEEDRCLNDPGDKDVIHTAVQKVANKSPYIVHCETPSVQGGNMSNITDSANAKLKNGRTIHYAFMAVQGNPNKMYLYMYYAEYATSNNKGKTTLTYFQVFSYSDAKGWYADGTYIGSAKIAYLKAGGNGNQSAWTVDPSTWVYGEPEHEIQ